MLLKESTSTHVDITALVQNLHVILDP